MSFCPTLKQKTAIHFLTDYETEFVGYGGAAGGGKSYLGCYWLMQLGFYAPKTKYFIGRDSLKDTRESVLQTWRKLSGVIGFHKWKYSDNAIVFDNGSLIDFLDLSFYPQKDPMFERFGSKEYTCGWIEEASQCHPLAFEILKTRIGRYLNDEYKIKKKILCTFNPRKNWVDTTFYRPFKEGKERPDTRFIFALPNDNPFLPNDYIETLRNLKDKATKERLLNGNFDYDDDPNVLISYDKVVSAFTNSFVSKGQRYITADIARFGKDSTVVIVWDGWRVVSIYVYTKQSITATAQAIQELAFRNQIPMSNVIVDEDGVGGGLKDILACKGFVNNSRPLKGENFENLKSQCSFHFADQMNLDKVYIYCEDETVRKLITEEVQQIKQKNMDGDGKKGVISKDDVKISLGRSPDYSDALIMRSYFDISFNNVVY